MSESEKSIRIDRLRDEFETEWKEGTQPQIEDFLGRLSDESRSNLFRELLLLELHLLSQSHVIIDRIMYSDRFAEYSSIVDSVFDEFGESFNSAAIDSTILGIPSDGSSPTYVANGVCLGDYELLGKIGRGGMGIIYKARQVSADRIVALKLIRPDHLARAAQNDARLVMDRFRTEALAAAKIEHDYVVTVYEVGFVNGTNFLAMQYVAGKDLARYVSKNPLENRKAAGYMAPIARAVQQIHAAGIIHRDIKPGNILIDESKDRPLVTDFGLAKYETSDSDRLMPKGAFGSPSYMPPEQVEDATQVTESADVYSLGATLYHLITGRPPFQASTASQTMLQVMREDPLLPSELNPNIDLDLEAICLKCLNKDPSRRFASAQELAEELERFLRQEPVQSRRISKVGRLVRWSRRNREISNVVLGAAALLIIATILTTIASVKAGRALEEKTKQERIANERRMEALTYLGFAQDAVDENILQLAKDRQLRSAGLEQLRREQFNLAREHYQRLSELEPQDDALRRAHGRAIFLLASIDVELGSPDKALHSLNEAISLQRRLANSQRTISSQSDLAASLASLALIWSAQGDHVKARQVIDESCDLRMLNMQAEESSSKEEIAMASAFADSAYVHESANELELAIKAYQNGLKILTPLVDRNPDNDLRVIQLQNLNDVARLYALLDDIEEAISSYRRVIQLGNAVIIESETSRTREDPRIIETIAASQSNLSKILLDQGMTTRAIELSQDSANLYEKLVFEHSAIPRYRLKLAQSLSVLAVCRESENDIDAALQSCDAAIEHVSYIAKYYPEVPEFTCELAAQYLNGALIHAARGNRTAEAEQLALAFAVLEEVDPKYRLTRHFRLTKVQVESSQVGLLVSQGDHLQAIEAYGEILTRLHELFDDDPSWVSDSEIAQVELNLGSLLMAEQKYDKANEILVDAASRFEAAFGAMPTSLQVTENLASCYLQLGILLSINGDVETAREYLTKAEVFLKSASGSFPEADSIKDLRGEVCFELIQVVDSSERLYWLQQAGESWASLDDVKSLVGSPEKRERSILTLSMFARSQQNWEDAIRWYDIMLEIHTIGINPLAEADLRDAISGRIECREKTDDLTGAALDRLSLAESFLRTSEIESAVDALESPLLNRISASPETFTNLIRSWEGCALVHLDEIEREEDRQVTINRFAAGLVKVLQGYAEVDRVAVREAIDLTEKEDLSSLIRESKVFRDFLQQVR